MAERRRLGDSEGRGVSVARGSTNERRGRRAGAVNVAGGNGASPARRDRVRGGRETKWGGLAARSARGGHGADDGACRGRFSATDG
jgi:hypothetical protein